MQRWLLLYAFEGKVKVKKEEKSMDSPTLWFVSSTDSISNLHKINREGGIITTLFWNTEHSIPFSLKLKHTQNTPARYTWHHERDVSYCRKKSYGMIKIEAGGGFEAPAGPVVSDVVVPTRAERHPQAHQRLMPVTTSLPTSKVLVHNAATRKPETPPSSRTAVARRATSSALTILSALCEAGWKRIQCEKNCCHHYTNNCRVENHRISSFRIVRQNQWIGLFLI